MSDVFVSFKGSTHAPILIGEGISPFVLDATHVARFTPTGIFVTDLSSGMQVPVLVQQLDRVVQVVVSPDRSHIAWTDPVSGMTTVGVMTPSTFTKVRTISERITHPVLSDSSLYDLRIKKEGAELWKYGFSDEAGRHTATLPTFLHVWNLSL
jgi:hypothetical protein